MCVCVCAYVQFHVDVEIFKTLVNELQIEMSMLLEEKQSC